LQPGRNKPKRSLPSPKTTHQCPHCVAPGQCCPTHKSDTYQCEPLQDGCER
jgi:hypothetical protein